MILIEYPKVELVEKQFYVDQINKLTIQMIAKRKGYQLFFTNNPLTTKNELLNRLVVIVTKAGEDSYHIDIKQNSGKTGKPLRMAWAMNVPKRFLLLQARLSLLESLYGKMVAKEERVLLKKNDVAFKEFLEKREKSEALEKSSEETDEEKESAKNPVKKKSKNKKPGQRTGNYDEGDDITSPESSLDSTLNFDEALAIQEGAIELNSKRFKGSSVSITDKEIEEIEMLQKNVRSSLKSKAEDLNQKDEKSEKTEKDNSDPSAEAPAFVLENKAKTEENPYDKATRPRETRTLLDLVYLNRSLTTSYLIDTTNNFNFIGGRITHRKNLSETSGDDLIFSFMNLKSLGLNEVKYLVPDVRNAHFQYLSAFKYLPFDVLFGLHYENQFFITLPELNEGLKVAENHLIWAQAGIERVFEIKGALWIIQGLFAKNIFSKSNFMTGTDVKLDATRFSVGSEVIYKKWRVGVQFSKENLTSDTLSDLNIQQSSYFLNLAYALSP